MSAEPLTREERALMDEWSATGVLPDGSERILQTLRETEEERDVACADRLSAHRNALAAIARAEAAEERAERAEHLIDYAMLLHEFGEAPPGHELATWGGWYRSVREFFGHERSDDAARDDA